MALLLKQPGYLTLKMGGKMLLKGDPGAIIHLLGPQWRTVDAGNGQSTAITFSSPLDPQEIKYYTIDWTVEMAGTSDTIATSDLTLSPAATAAGVTIRATTNDTSKVTLWLTIADDMKSASQWQGAGETHTLSNRITTTAGQIFERTIRLIVRHI